MADVLIVCVREDEPLAKAFADMFERAGLHVGGAPGAPDDMRSCGAALVVWSQASIRSRAFLDAAQRAVNAGKAVVACLIAPPPPASINHAPAFDLSQWTGDPDDQVLDPLFFAVDRMVAAARAAAGVAAPVAAVARVAAEPQTSYFAPPPAAPPYARARPNAPASARPSAPRTAPSFDPPPRAPAPARRPAAHAQEMRDPDHTAAEAQNWAAIRHSRNPEDFLRHLADYGSEGAFAELAQMKLAELEAEARRRKQTPAAVARQDSMRGQSARLEPTRPVLPRPEPVRHEAPQPRGAQVRPPPAAFEPIHAEPPRPRAPAMRPPVRREPPPVWRDEGRGEVMRRAAPPSRQSGGPVRLAVIIVVLGAGALGAGLFVGDRLGGPNLNGEGQTEANADSWDNAAPPETETRTASLQLDEREPSRASAPIDPPLEERSSPARAPTRSETREQRRQNLGGPVEEREPVPAPRMGPDRRDSAPAPAATITTAAAAPQPLTSSAPASQPATQPAPQPIQVASAATPAPPPAAARPAARPFVVWAQRPSGQRLSELFPQRPLRTGQGGRVELDCLIDTGGVPRCAVARETPPGFGFGSAAVRASAQYRSGPTLSDGTPSIGAQTRLTIVFPSPGER